MGAAQLTELERVEKENDRLKKSLFCSHFEEVGLERGIKGKLLSPVPRRAYIDQVGGKLQVSERRICRVLGQHRSTQRRPPRGRADEECLVADMIELTRQYGRYGYRRIAALLRDAGWQVDDKRIEPPVAM